MIKWLGKKPQPGGEGNIHDARVTKDRTRELLKELVEDSIRLDAIRKDFASLNTGAPYLCCIESDGCLMLVEAMRRGDMYMQDTRKDIIRIQTVKPGE